MKYVRVNTFFNDFGPLLQNLYRVVTNDVLNFVLK